jgi:hypothetical protein
VEHGAESRSIDVTKEDQFVGGQTLLIGYQTQNGGNGSQQQQKYGPNSTA